jgi:6-phosphogluconolactonase
MSEVAVVQDVAGAAAELFLEATAGAVAARGRAAVALTGGSTAAPLYARLDERVPYSALDIFFTDERAVPPTDPLSNYGVAAAGALLARVQPSRVHRMKGEAKDQQAEARRAANELRSVLGTPPRFDLVMVGLGTDGHIFSLFAGVPGSGQRGDDELVRAVAAPEHVEPHVPRLTLTPFLAETARMVVLQVTGANKAEVLARALKGPEDLVACPAQWLRRAAGRVVVVCDPACAAAL